jgi:hypothetical protein
MGRVIVPQRLALGAATLVIACVAATLSYIDGLCVGSR